LYRKKNEAMGIEDLGGRKRGSKDWQNGKI
jgi:hypothetical protein